MYNAISSVHSPLRGIEHDVSVVRLGLKRVVYADYLLLFNCLRNSKIKLDIVRCTWYNINIGEDYMSDYSFNYKRIQVSKEEQEISDKNWDNIDWSDTQVTDTNKLPAEEKG